MAKGSSGGYTMMDKCNWSVQETRVCGFESWRIGLSSSRNWLPTPDGIDTWPNDSRCEPRCSCDG